MTHPQPLVTAVIPTRNRPSLVVRAVRSVLRQEAIPLEIVIVVDGPDDSTLRALTAIDDPRVRTLPLQSSVGGSEARNTGARSARGEWIAFLDDDDEWLPGKLRSQFEQLHTLADPQQFIFCGQVLARSPEGEAVWPEKSPAAPYSEYLLVRNRLTYGEGLIQTSTILAHRTLLDRVPFQAGLKKHQDWDWVLRATAEGAQIAFLKQPLAIWNLDEGRARVSSENSWRVSMEWIRSSRNRVTPRAYASFIATYVAPQAAASSSASFLELAKEMFSPGSPRLRDLAVFLASWVFPPSQRQRLRAFLRGRRFESAQPKGRVMVDSRA